MTCGRVVIINKGQRGGGGHARQPDAPAARIGGTSRWTCAGTRAWLESAAGGRGRRAGRVPRAPTRGTPPARGRRRGRDATCGRSSRAPWSDEGCDLLGLAAGGDEPGGDLPAPHHHGPGRGRGAASARRAGRGGDAHDRAAQRLRRSSRRSGATTSAAPSRYVAALRLEHAVRHLLLIAYLSVFLAAVDATAQQARVRRRKLSLNEYADPPGLPQHGRGGAVHDAHADHAAVRRGEAPGHDRAAGHVAAHRPADRAGQVPGRRRRSTPLHDPAVPREPAAGVELRAHPRRSGSPSRTGAARASCCWAGLLHRAGPVRLDTHPQPDRGGGHRVQPVRSAMLVAGLDRRPTAGPVLKVRRLPRRSPTTWRTWCSGVDRPEGRRVLPERDRCSASCSPSSRWRASGGAHEAPSSKLVHGLAPLGILLALGAFGLRASSSSRCRAAPPSTWWWASRWCCCTCC